MEGRDLALAHAEVTPSLSPPPPVPQTDFFPRVFFFLLPALLLLEFSCVLGVNRLGFLFHSTRLCFILVRVSPFSTPLPFLSPSGRALTMRATAAGTGTAGTAAASSGKAPPTTPADGDGRFSVLSWEQVQRLDHILGEAVPIHGRGNFPTLSVRPRRIVQVRKGAEARRGPPPPHTHSAWGPGWDDLPHDLPQPSLRGGWGLRVRVEVSFGPGCGIVGEARLAENVSVVRNAHTRAS